MMDKIERFAEAIAQEFRANPVTVVHNPDLAGSCFPMASAAVQAMPGMEPAVETDLRRVFGYVPDERGGENWTVYQDHTLIVIHPERRPRLYKRGCGGTYYEIEPDPR